MRTAIACLLFLATATSFAEEPLHELTSKALDFARLEGKNLTGADLSGAEMTMAHLARAKLHKADFSRAKLDRIELMDADLSESVGWSTVNYGFGINAQRANFQRAELAGAKADGSYFEGEDFRGANLRGAVLQGRFHEAKFADADVQGTVFVGTSRIESLFAELRGRGAIVDAAGFEKAVQGGRDFSDCPLEGIELPKAQLNDGQFQRASLRYAKLQGASLRRTHLADAVLCFAQLQDADLREADLSKATFSGADLTGADLTNANCRGTEFGTSLRGVKFNGADLTNADFSYCDLTGADLKGAILEGVKWESAIVKDLRGVAPAKQEALQSQAARWKHDLSQTFDHVVRHYSKPGWFLSLLAGAAVLVIGWRAKRHLSLKLIGIMHCVATLPILAFAFLFLSGTALTAQLNGGGLDGWTTWVSLWPAMFGLAALTVLGYLPVALSAWIVCFRSAPRGTVGYLAAATLLTGLALLGSVGTLLLLAPTA
jgi:uncharacterized protein YjbI with pentapeptide repeats